MNTKNVSHVCLQGLLGNGNGCRHRDESSVEKDGEEFRFSEEERGNFIKAPHSERSRHRAVVGLMVSPRFRCRYLGKRPAACSKKRRDELIEILAPSDAVWKNRSSGELGALKAYLVIRRRVDCAPEVCSRQGGSCEVCSRNISPTKVCSCKVCVDEADSIKPCPSKVCSRQVCAVKFGPGQNFMRKICKSKFLVFEVVKLQVGNTWNFHQGRAGDCFDDDHEFPSVFVIPDERQIISSPGYHKFPKSY